ncbi:MAG: hypothetical protein LKF37_10165 [Lentilactobacillus diolivorans]|jgi:hypothetical protein|nr:hypothetical protein [Lentilactobacillus diolivorans]
MKINAAMLINEIVYEQANVNIKAQNSDFNAEQRVFFDEMVTFGFPRVIRKIMAKVSIEDSVMLDLESLREGLVNVLINRKNQTKDYISLDERAEIKALRIALICLKKVREDDFYD